ncbi:MAG: hypothetical protein AAF360_03325 [Pseudomonadota bacterium]
MLRLISPTLPALFVIVASAQPAFAYIGPGAGLSAIGTLLALFAAVLLAVVGFLWYPLKRLMRRRPASGPSSPDNKSGGPRS